MVWMSRASGRTTEEKPENMRRRADRSQAHVVRMRQRHSRSATMFFRVFWILLPDRLANPAFGPLYRALRRGCLCRGTRPARCAALRTASRGALRCPRAGTRPPAERLAPSCTQPDRALPLRAFRPALRPNPCAAVPGAFRRVCGCSTRPRQAVSHRVFPGPRASARPPLTKDFPFVPLFKSASTESLPSSVAILVTAIWLPCRSVAVAEA